MEAACEIGDAVPKALKNCRRRFLRLQPPARDQVDCNLIGEAQTFEDTPGRDRQLTERLGFKICLRCLHRRKRVCVDNRRSHEELPHHLPAQRSADAQRARIRHSSQHRPLKVGSDRA